MRTAVLIVPAADAELAADRLWAAGARGVEERANGDGGTSLHAVLAADDEVSRARLGTLPVGWRLGFEDADDEPSATWRDHARPTDVGGGLVLRPAWIAPTRARCEIAIEPGGSFGLGDHPTTILSAAAAWRVVRAGESVLDVGSGSGVLSLVAARRGASRIVAIDVSDAAVAATRANAVANGAADLIEASATPISEIADRFDVVLANLLAPTIVSMAADLRRVTRRLLVISGVLDGRFEHVVDALAPLEVHRVARRDGWAAVELVPPVSPVVT